jgi:hypothetical protein
MITMELAEHRMNHVVEACKPLLAGAWERHTSETDIIILSDMGRDDITQAATDFWRLFGSGVPTLSVDGRDWCAMLQREAFLDPLAQGGFAQREAAKELRGFAAARRSGLNVVPLFVVQEGGHWATMWGPPESNVVPIRHEPQPEPDRN